GDTVGLVNFPGPDADGSATAFASGFQVFDNGDAEKLQVAKDFLSYVYTDERWLDYAAGAIPARPQDRPRRGTWRGTDRIHSPPRGTMPWHSRK
ncbi:hypothetical protein P0G11_14045, partial [Adlercreutzia rubneri]|nr:hypothetical protein [Adlercreutzia rubneri]